MVVAQKCLDRVPVGLEAIRPPVVPHVLPQLFDVGGEPGQHGLECRSLLEVFVDETGSL